jgi:leader peptidase (prepilin peptidase)/N-methyltransferase
MIGTSQLGLPAALVWTFLLGVAALLGSFLNVCISRLPRGESVVLPASHCPNCKAPIRACDNIPLVSFVLLRGRCRACRHPISWRYPSVEALAIAIGVLVVWQVGPTWQGLRVFLLGLALVAVTFIDLEHLLIPDRITLPGIVVGLLTALYPTPAAIGSAIGGCLLAGGLFYLVALASRGGLGGGDVKLAAMIGAFLGWRLALVAVFLAVLGGGIVGIGLLVAGLKGRKDAVPFGPFLALGGFVAALWGGPVLGWYLR